MSIVTFLGNVCLSQVSLHIFFCHTRNNGYSLAELTQVDTRSNSPHIKEISQEMCSPVMILNPREQCPPKVTVGKANRGKRSDSLATRSLMMA